MTTDLVADAATPPAPLPASSSWAFPVAGALLAGATAGGVAAVAPASFAPATAFVGAYLVAPLGLEVWLGLGQILFGLPLGLVAVLILAVNASVSLVLAGVPLEALVARVPRVGAKVARLEARVRASRAARRGIAWGIAVVVALPLHSGGAILATLAARGLGLTPLRAFLAVASGVLARLLAALAVVQGYLWLG